MDKYSWNFNEDAERWYESADSIAECIADARAAVESGEYGQTDTVYIGVNVPFIPSVDAESVLEAVEQQAYEFDDDAGEDWNAFDSRKMREELEELSDTLSAVVIAWLKKYGREPNYYRVEGAKPYALYPEKDGHNA